MHLLSLEWPVRQLLLLSVGGFALAMLTYAGYVRLGKGSRTDQTMAMNI